MAENSQALNCQEHGRLLECVCMICKSLLCLSCADTHPRHPSLFGDKTDIIHILPFSALTLDTYSRAISDLTTKLPPLQPAIPTAREQVSAILTTISKVEERVRATAGLLGKLHEQFATLLKKLDAAAGVEREVTMLQCEQRELDRMLRRRDLHDLIKFARSSQRAVNRPRLATTDLTALNQAANTLKACGEQDYPQLLAALTNLTKNSEVLETQLRSVVQSERYTEILEEYKRPAAAASASPDVALKQAIASGDANEVYRVLSRLVHNGVSTPRLINLCLAVERAPIYLCSYALQRRIVNPADGILMHLYETLVKAELAKDAATIAKLQGLNLKERMEYSLVRDVLKETEIRAQERKVTGLLKLPKDRFVLSKLALDQYLNYMQYQSKFVNILKRNKHPDWADTMLHLDSLLKVVHYANQMPFLEPEVDAMAKKLAIPKKHMAIIRLKAYGQATDWDGFLRYLKKDNWKLPPVVLAEICVLYKNPRLAVEFIKKIPDKEQQVYLYIENESIIEAVDVAVQSQDPYLLEELRNRVLWDLTPYIAEAQKKLKK